MSLIAEEIKARQRFEFGENWSRFLKLLDEDRISDAERSLCSMLEVKTLEGKTFLDVGSGSGLFSLAARRLGATVYSFDYDPQSVSCARELKQRYFADDPHWTISEGSILDPAYLQSLGSFDVVYSWGVLHHTGAMWTALANTVPLVAPAGKLFIAIYNDQGSPSRRWKRLKSLYNRAPSPGRSAIVALVGLYFLGRWTCGKLARLENPMAHGLKIKRKERGMAVWPDLLDWVGGYPFEVAKPEEIFQFFRDRHFSLSRLKTCAGGLGCNEYVFVKQTI